MFDSRIQVLEDGSGIIQFTEEEAQRLGLELGKEYEIVLIEDSEGLITGIEFEEVDEEDDEDS